MELMFISFIIGVVVGLAAALYGGLKGKAIQKPEEIKPQETTKREIKKNPWREKRSKIGVDHQKRKTLMPANQAVVPKGFESKDGELAPSLELPVKDYQFKFYGSQLLIEGRAILHGLTAGMHRIEVTEDNTVYCDGKEIKLIGKDIDSIKQAVLMNEQE